MTLPAQLDPRNEVFALPRGGDYIVYAPLAGRAVRVNGRCVEQFRTYLRTLDPSVVDRAVRDRVGGLEWLTQGHTPVPLPVDRQFHPTYVTLFLTNRCNLRCRYCYADAGDFEPHDMPAEVYRAAIDLVVRNAARAGHPAGVGFHGGGEPTTAWNVLTDAVAYARRIGEGAGKPGVRFGIATNGVMSPDRADFVARTFPVVTLSFDGPPDLQNGQRPRADGSGSFEQVMAFVERLHEAGTPFVVRATITRRNVMRMPEMVDFFVDRVRCRMLHFEPVFSSGRCSADASQLAAPDEFAEHFVAAMDRASEQGARLRFSAARLMGAFLSFCGCSQDGFNVTHNGELTGCFEICEADQPLSGDFFFGRFDTASGRFLIDYSRLARLRAMNVYDNPACARCFAKWNCGGDCPVKRMQGSPSGRDSDRCRMIRTITEAMLERALHRQERMDASA